MSAPGMDQKISHNVYEDLVHYFKYASSAYSLVCPRPNGKKLVMPFANISGDIQGYVARDDDRQEIIVAFRGSASIMAFLADASIILVPFIASGIKAPSGVRVHSGFLLSWDSVAVQVRLIISQQLKAHPNYSIVTSGHSLGGVMALFCAMMLKQHHPDTQVRTYSYGAPRAGNKAFATFVNDTFGENAYRVCRQLYPPLWDTIITALNIGNTQILHQRKQLVCAMPAGKIRNAPLAYAPEESTPRIGHTLVFLQQGLSAFERNIHTRVPDLQTALNSFGVYHIPWTCIPGGVINYHDCDSELGDVDDLATILEQRKDVIDKFTFAVENVTLLNLGSNAKARLKRLV